MLDWAEKFLIPFFGKLNRWAMTHSVEDQFSPNHSFSAVSLSHAAPLATPSHCAAVPPPPQHLAQNLGIPHRSPPHQGTRRSRPQTQSLRINHPAAHLPPRHGFEDHQTKGAKPLSRGPQGIDQPPHLVKHRPHLQGFASGSNR